MRRNWNPIIYGLACMSLTFFISLIIFSIDPEEYSPNKIKLSLVSLVPCIFIIIAFSKVFDFEEQKDSYYENEIKKMKERYDLSDQQYHELLKYCQSSEVNDDKTLELMFKHSDQRKIL